MQHQHTICNCHRSIIENWPRLTWAQQNRLVVEVWLLAHPAAGYLIALAAAAIGAALYVSITHRYWIALMQSVAQIFGGGVMPIIA
jgi:hypothetical protein